MATAAELKARLLKYATKPATSAEVPVEKPIFIGADNVQQQEESQTVATESSPEPAIDNRYPEGSGPLASVGAVLPVVQTDLQPTTLVVVERPVELVVGQSEVAIGDEGLGTVEDGDTRLDRSNPIHQAFLQRLADLEVALLARDPLMKTHLGEIHKTMINYEEVPNLLTVAEISKIMAAQQVHTGIVLRKETVSKSKAAASKKANQLSINDV